MPRVTIFLVTLINCDSNAYSHVPYKPLQDCEYKKKTLQNSPFTLKYKSQLFKFFIWVILNFTVHYQILREM
jgi:hypothetical protein